MIEREQECARLRAALADGGLVLIEGPAGSGRSLLLEHTRREARERDVAVFAARAGELEQAFAFGVVRQLFERELLGASAQRRAELLTGAAALAAPAIGLDDGAAPAVVDAPFSVLHGVYWLVANLAAERPCCSRSTTPNGLTNRACARSPTSRRGSKGSPSRSSSRCAPARPRGRSKSSRSRRVTCCGPRR